MTDPAAATSVATDPPDHGLPGDWNPRRLLALAIAGQAVFGLLALSRALAGQTPGSGWLGALWAAVLCAATLLAGLALARCVAQASSLTRGFLLRGGAVLALIAFLAPPGLGAGTVSAASYGWKALATLAFLVAGWLLFTAMARLHGARDAHRGLALWLWNPFPVLVLCGFGHHHAVTALLLAAMVACVVKARAADSVVGLGAAMALRPESAVLAPLLLGHWACQGRARRFLVGAGVALLGALVVAYMCARSQTWSHGDRELGPFDWLVWPALWGNGSLPALADSIAGYDAARAVVFLGLALAVCVLVAGWRKVKDPTALGHCGVLAMAVYLLASVPGFGPDDHLLWLPLFALCTVPVVPRVVELLGWLVPFSWLPLVAFGPELASVRRFQAYVPDLTRGLWEFALAALWPLALLLLEWRRLCGLPARKAGASPEGE
jgi:hypothetical protein